MTPVGLSIAVVPSLIAAAPVEAPRPVPRERIGTVLGEPIYRNQIRTGPETSLVAELFRLIQPALDRYREEHRDEVTPTAEEIEFAAAYFLKQDPEKWEERRREARKQRAELDEQLTELDAASALKGWSAEELEEAEAVRGEVEAVRKKLGDDIENPARFFAGWLLEKRKFERHLYSRFGGGRVLFQQAGVEAFDATRRWLESLETKGDFTIDDRELRAELYRYWTDTRHGAFLSAAEEDSRAVEEFVNPPWFPAKDE